MLSSFLDIICTMDAARATFVRHVWWSAQCVFAATILVTYGSAIYNGHVPYLPCQISVTASTSPEKEYFMFGCLGAGCVLLGMFARLDEGQPLLAALGIASSVGVILLGWFDTKSSFVVHALGANGAFLFAFIYLYIKEQRRWWTRPELPTNYDRVRFLGMFALCTVLRVALSATVAIRLFTQVPGRSMDEVVARIKDPIGLGHVHLVWLLRANALLQFASIVILRFAMDRMIRNETKLKTV